MAIRRWVRADAAQLRACRRPRRTRGRCL